MYFMRAVPPEFIDGVMSGAYRVTGSVVRDVSSGRGVAFLQETNLLQSLLGSALRGVGATLQNGFSPLGTLAVIQNQQIKSRLAEVQSSLSILQNLQVGTLAVSGLGLGVSVAGFALVLKRLKGIESHLGSIETKIDRITEDRRQDDLHMIFADIGTQLEAVDTLSTRSNKVSAAQAAERALATSAGRLETVFQKRSPAMQSEPITLADIEMLWSLAAAIRLCHEAGLRALFGIDELQAARELAVRRAERFLEMSQALSPDTLARLCGQNAKDVVTYTETRRLTMPQAEILVAGLRDSVASVGGQSELASALIEKGISGPTYLNETANEKEAPLLILPT